MEKLAEPKQRRKFVGWKRILVYGILSCLALVLIMFVGICFSIRSAVKQMSTEATKEYPGDRVEALIAYVRSENHSLKKRNRAVWVLGQIGDKSALPVLESFYTGGECDHEKQLCQRELKHAIYDCKGGLNLNDCLSSQKHISFLLLLAQGLLDFRYLFCSNVARGFLYHVNEMGNFGRSERKAYVTLGAVRCN